MKKRQIIILIFFLLFSCKTEKSEIILSKETKSIIEKCQYDLGAKSIDVIKAKDIDDIEIPNSFNIIFTNCEYLNMENRTIEEYQERVVELIIENINKSDLPDFIQITFAEEMEKIIYNKYNSNGRGFSKEYIQSAYSIIHSRNTTLKKKLNKLIALKNFKDGKLICDSVIKYDNKNEIAFQYRGLLNYNLANTNSAILDFNQAIKINPLNSENYLNLAIIYGSLNKIDQALIYIDTTLTIDSNNAKAIYYRGDFNLQKGDTLRACDDLKTAEKLGFEISGTNLYFRCKE